MLRKLLIAGVSVVLTVCLIITCVQLIPRLSSLELDGPGDRFERAEKRYTVTANAGDGGRVEGAKEDYAKGETVNLFAVANEGYLFSGWYTNKGELTGTALSHSFNIEKNTVINAKFTPAPDDMSGEISSEISYVDTSADQVKSIDLAALESYLSSTEGGEYLSEQIKDLLFSNPAYASTVASASQALYNAAEKSGYTVSLISKENVKDRTDTYATARIEKEFKDGVEVQHIVVDINVFCTTPVINSDGIVVSSFELRFGVTESITLTPIISDSVTSGAYNIGIGMKVDETADVSFSFIDSGEKTLDALKGDFENEIKKTVLGGGVYNKIKDAFAEAGSNADISKEIKLFASPITVDVKGFDMTFDIGFFMNLEIAASLEYSSECSQYLELGIRYGNDGPVYYEKKSSNATCRDLTVAGSADVHFGINASFDFALGVEDYVSFDTQLGSYTDISGVAAVGKGHSAASLELSSYARTDYAYSLFGENDSKLDTVNTKSIFKFGYKNSAIGYVNGSKMEKDYSFSIINKETDISEIPFLSLAVLDADTLTLVKEALSATSEHYTVKITLGKNSRFSYENGKLILKDGAPAYFKETITISIIPTSSRWTKFDESKVYVDVPTVAVKLVFGDADGYYEATDTVVQKEFRRIYRGYNKANADVLIGGFEELIESFVNIPENKKTLYHDFTSAYLTEIFGLIDEYRALDDNKRTMENKFVYGEANIFDTAVVLIYDIMDGKVLEEEAERARIYTLFTDAESTTALYNTLIKVQDSEALKAQIAESMNPVTKLVIEAELNDYEAQNIGNERAAALVSAARALFGF